MYVKKYDKVAQENVGTDSLKALSFIGQDSLDQLPVVVAMCTDRCHTACHRLRPE